MSDLPPLPGIKLGRYRHYKGGEYEVIGVVRHSETLEPLVLYRTLYNDSGLWVRPHSMFFEEVEHEGQRQRRFAFVSPGNAMDGVLIRRATAADATALAALAESTFRQTFANENSEGDMRRHCDAHFGAAIQEQEIRDPGIVTLLAESATALIGFAQLRMDRSKECVRAARPAELHRIYVLSDHQGTGLARRLLDAATAAARDAGADYVWLGVWERNPRAMAFYAKAGFTEIGEHEFVLGNDRQRDVVMGRPLAG